MTFEMKAEPLTTSQLDRWLAGKIPRRILVAPFGGPLAKARKGVDLDLERFDDEPCGEDGCTGTDFFGPYPSLKANRARMVDFHHTTFLEGRPTSPAEDSVKGAIMGQVVLDDHFAEEDPGFAGLWGDFWANAGEKRRSLLRWLEERGHPLYGSSQPVQAGVRRGKAGHLCVWPIQFHTISTAPQNTLAVVPPIKARFDDPNLAELSVGALRAYLTGADDLGSDLLSIAAADGLPGKGDAKAGQVAADEERTTQAIARLLAAGERVVEAISLKETA